MKSVKCNLKCTYLATVSRLFDEKEKVVQAYCRKYDCDLSCYGGIVRKVLKCKENVERKRRKNERLQSF